MAPAPLGSGLGMLDPLPPVAAAVANPAPPPPWEAPEGILEVGVVAAPAVGVETAAAAASRVVRRETGALEGVAMPPRPAGECTVARKVL